MSKFYRTALGLIIKSLLFNYLPREIKNNNNSKIIDDNFENISDNELKILVNVVI